MNKPAITSISTKSDQVTNLANDGIEKNRRSDARVSSVIPIKLSNLSGQTHNISAKGIFFEIEKTPIHLRSLIEFSLQLDTPGGKIFFVCEGKVVRLEKRDGKLGVAAKITSQTLQKP